MEKLSRVFVKSLKNCSPSARAELFARVLLKETSKPAAISRSLSTTPANCQQLMPRPKHKFLPTTYDDPDRSSDPLLPRLMDMRNGEKVRNLTSAIIQLIIFFHIDEQNWCQK